MLTTIITFLPYFLYILFWIVHVLGSSVNPSLTEEMLQLRVGKIRDPGSVQDRFVD